MLFRSINPAMAESIQNLVQQQLDWEYLIKIAHQHGIFPLFYHNLQKNCSNLVPSNVLSDLRSRSQEVACYNLSLARELLAIVKLCKSQQIPVLPYKGSVLATLLYGNLTLRSSSDLDIVVLPTDFFKVKALLNKRGYQTVSAPTREDLQEICYRSNYECPLISKDSKIIVELHPAFADPCLLFPLKLADILDELNSVSILGTSLPCLQQETLLIVLCMHGCKDVWKQLKWICDIAQLISLSPHLDWEKVWQRAEKLASRRRLFLGLLLANQLFDTPLPETVLQKINSDSKIQVFAQSILQRLFTSDDFSVFDKVFLWFICDSLTDTVRQYFKYLGYLIRPNPRDLDLVYLPVWLYFLYYFIRPVRLIWQYGGDLIKVKIFHYF